MSSAMSDKNDMGMRMVDGMAADGPVDGRAGGRLIMCYTRTPSNQEEANNADVALSMHLALKSRVDGSWTALNEDYGILFAAGVPRPGIDRDARRACVASAEFPEEGERRAEGNAFSDAVRYGAVMPGVDIQLNSLCDPFLFHTADGGFAVVATRTKRGGEPDGSQRSSFLLAVSHDLLRFQQLGQVTLAVDDGVHQPQMCYDARSEAYIITWFSDEGVLGSASVRDLVDATKQTLKSEPSCMRHRAPEGDRALEASRVLGADRGVGHDWRIGNVIRISDACAVGLTERFGRIYNIGADVPLVHLDELVGGSTGDALAEYLHGVKARLHYSDGSEASRCVEWNDEDIKSIARRMDSGSMAGCSRVAVHGRVKQTIYPVPFARERADPSVFAWSWNGTPMYLFIATDDENGNCIDPHGSRAHLPMRVAASIEELSDACGGRAAEIDLLRKGDVNSEGRAMTGCFWAPEFHVIAGRLSILFMPCFDGESTTIDGRPNDRAGLPDMWTGRCHIMQLKKDHEGADLDPRDVRNWSVPEPILRMDGSILNPIQRISLDMTVIQDADRWFYAWQQVGSVWIASFDPSHPSRLTSDPSQIIVPEFAWDNMIAEGPNAIVHDGRIYLIYSGSAVGIDYATGLVTAPAGVGADLLDPASWMKLDYPLQKSGVYNGAWQLGTGHGMWSNDEDGNLIYVFHNARFEHDRYLGRDAQVRRVHWSAEGMPILDMQTSEELDPSCRDVVAQITVY